jgi:hypothetical protein
MIPMFIALVAVMIWCALVNAWLWFVLITTLGTVGFMLAGWALDSGWCRQLRERVARKYPS